MILAGIATYFNSRASVARQSPEAAANPQTAMMNKLALYVFPLGVVVGGPFLPLAIIMYWLSNNIWTFGQQHYVFGKIEKEEEAKKQEVLDRRSANAPAPGRQAGRRPQGRGIERGHGDGRREIAADSESAATPATNGAEAESRGATSDGEPIADPGPSDGPGTNPGPAPDPRNVSGDAGCRIRRPQPDRQRSTEETEE